MYMIRLEKLLHKGRNQTAIFFEYQQEIKEYVLEITGVRWSRTYRCFYVLEEKYSLGWLFQYFRKRNWMVDYSAMQHTGYRAAEQPIGAFDLPPAGEEIIEAVNRFRRWMFSKRYSDNTIKTYS